MSTIEISKANQDRVVAAWLADFEAMLNRGDLSDLATLFHPDGYWRDLLAMSWQLRTFHGTFQIERGLRGVEGKQRPRSFRFRGEATQGQLGEFGATVEGFFTFETDLAYGRGYLRLAQSDSTEESGYLAVTLLTAMAELKGFPERRGRHRDRTFARAVEGNSDNWLDRRQADIAYRDRDPEVIIVGAGQAGLALAARLRHLDVDALVVDRDERIGDVWRKRYHSLTLHNEICTNHFPYMPFPDSWPVFIPKDKLANWMEFYADAMEINVWARTEFLGANYADGRWTTRLRTPEGGIRVMRPSHVVLAVGVSGLPNIPGIEGLDEFEGTVIHSSGQTNDIDTLGKSALIVGAGTSGHDIAQDLHLRGAHVTMLQRSSTTVVSVEPSSTRAYELYQRNEGVRPIEDIDLMSASIPYDLVRRLHGPLSRRMAEDDHDLLDRLRKVGFELDNGEDDTGFFLKLLRRLGGYYLNVGASDLIADGKIKLKSGVTLERLEGKRAVFSDGSILDLDLLVLATGYKPLQEAVRALLGDEIADRVGPIWGIGADGELCNMFCATRQDGFYVMGGTLTLCRSFSRYTALIIKARLEGLVDCSRARRSAGMRC
ncbi:NAD(P)/FAD-dependent oxidoreductase [Bradyrhizobium prioriisuperbiae]|uniref:NAD(P)/FAD-dependent oxidoreductase n=1 Tax=Bradyrhizobium prioriisuperbiae TaxID=2854389 RepID=UPI0028EF721A|nr:NAD(P)/FAD-dependent oxidoreductase [Bradyrhizobium prioritasuperba]